MSHEQVIQHDPSRYSQDRNGTIHDKQLYNRIVKGQKEPNFTDPDKTRHAHTVRREAATKAALEGIQTATAQNTPANAWRTIIEARARAAMDADNPQGNAATRLIGEATGIMQPAAAQDPDPAGITINIDAQTAARILAAIASRPPASP